MRLLNMKAPSVLPTPVRARGGYKKQQQQNCFQPQLQDYSCPFGQGCKDMHAWKAFGSQERSRGRGRGCQPGRGTRPPKEEAQYK